MSDSLSSLAAIQTETHMHFPPLGTKTMLHCYINLGQSSVANIHIYNEGTNGKTLYQAEENNVFEFQVCIFQTRIVNHSHSLLVLAPPTYYYDPLINTTMASLVGKWEEFTSHNMKI